MAEAEAKDSSPLMTDKEKLAGAIAVGVALGVSVLLLILTSVYAVPKMSSPPPKGYYPDIVKEDDWSTCWEATVFATTSDPFYQWVSGSGVADALNVSERGTLAYQRLSIWRVSGNCSSKNVSSVYSSPDPHLLGGQFVKKSKTRVWKMTVNWGLSVRNCFTLPGKSADECLFTTPIVQTSDGYAALMVGVPYRKASSDPFASSTTSLYLNKEASYLSNFVSNARTKPGLNLISTEMGDGNTKKYVYKGASCSEARPVVLVPDVLAYLGFPSIQCACYKRFCLLGRNLTLNSAENNVPSSLMDLSASGCREGSSFWDLDAYPFEENRTIFYSSKQRKSISLTVNLNTSFAKTIPFQSLQASMEAADAIEGFVSCIEATDLSQDAVFACRRPPIITFYPVFANLSDRYISRYPLKELMDTFDNKVPSDEDDVLCGLDQGQTLLADKLCTMNLTELRSADEMKKLDRRLQATLKLAEVKRFVKDEWDRGISQRSDIIVGLITAVVTVVVTIWGMFSRNLQDIEELILNKTQSIKNLADRTVGIPLFRTLMRGGVLLSVIIWNMFNVFRGFKSVTTKPRVATSGTLLQQLNGISFLVTTTSTVQVTPYWIIFYITGSVAVFVLVATTFCVYIRMRYLEKKEQNETASG